ncbi:MAG TPA: zinc ribbon domain-containing protein [Syntrophales bacterium]|nr:zinc ribbon domain-containing protein [Syntrophales bacterium]HOP34899.1 zinc ribbon domain-containing protein [Syntrophales bacterium]HPQ61228.1 zinc ribbon domain-containing protein [Syntrophales bacterium]
MPIYEYRCKHCKTRFETLRSLKDRDEDVVCPGCGKKKAEKQMSAPRVQTSSGGSSCTSCAATSCST